MKFNCIYSLGTDCRNETAISQLNLKRFSYIFGNMNSKTISNVNFSIKDNFRTLFNPSYHIPINKETNLFPEFYEKYGARTMHTLFDDIKNFHDATFAHHDMSDAVKQEHFKHAVRYFNILCKAKVPTLYVCKSSRTLNASLTDCLILADTLRELNPNSYCLILNLHDKNAISKVNEKYYANSKCSVFSETIDSVENNIIRIKQLISNYNFDSLITKEELLLLE